MNIRTSGPGNPNREIFLRLGLPAPLDHICSKQPERADSPSQGAGRLIAVRGVPRSLIELLCQHSPNPSRLRHRLALTRTGRGGGEDGRENPPVEPELSLRSVRLVRDAHQVDHFLATTVGLSSDATNPSVPLSRIMRSSPRVRGRRLGNPSRA